MSSLRRRDGCWFLVVGLVMGFVSRTFIVGSGSEGVCSVWFLALPCNYWGWLLLLGAIFLVGAGVYVVIRG